MGIGHAEQLLQAAQTLLDEPGQLGRGARRSAAMLTRGALEAALKTWLDRHAPGAGSANFTVQLLVLHRLLPSAEQAGRVAWAWSALSRATHHNGYELAPRRRELVAWMEVASGFVAEVRHE